MTIDSSSSSSPSSSSSSSSLSSFSASSSSSSIGPLWKFHVFLSFRGEDTRDGFTDHLYQALKRGGLHTYRDDEKLPRGETIRPSLLQAIKDSRFAVVVLSRNYAWSTWCLDELAKIIECKTEIGLKAFPVFYHVNPSEIRMKKRKQNGEPEGEYTKAFARHEQVFKDDLEKLKLLSKWREALNQIADVSGWDLKDGRSEHEIIQDVVKRIKKLVNDEYSSVNKDLVGMDSRQEKMLSYLEIERSDIARTIGIWGMGGIGKTTLAKKVFSEIRDHFEASCFVADVRLEAKKHNGLVHLQKFLYNNLLESDANIQTDYMGIHILRGGLLYRRVLIILDDVDEFKQIEDLCGNGGLGPGSRVIVTTRNKHLLKIFGDDKIFEVDKLSEADALKLLCRKAFETDHPKDGYMEQSKNVVKYANGLPLALEVLGSFLFKRDVDDWSSTLAELKDNPDDQILGVLQISFDGLRPTQQKTFLDIACFFKGEKIYRVEKILENGKTNIEVLLEKSLITVMGDKLWMHDLVQELGWEIVRRESSQVPGKRSRFWSHEDANVLVDNKGTQDVEGIFMSFPLKEELFLKVDPFSKMDKLRLLKICNVNFSGYLGFLSNELRFLEWHGYPLKSIPSTFKPDKLVELNLANSRIEQLWKVTKLLEKLISINLSNCQNLTETPNFNMIPKLERLILKGCKGLLEIHQSLGHLKHLVLLDLEGCERLMRLPNINLKSLKTFILSGCSNLTRFPEVEGNMEQLSILLLGKTSIRELPTSIMHLSGLIVLSLKDCRNLTSLPSVICNLTSLRVLYLSGCSRLDQLPESLGNLGCLEELDVSETAITKAPSSIVLLENLEQLSFRGCKGVMPRSLQSLFCTCCFFPTEGSESIINLQLPKSFSGLFSLRSLDLSKCNLQEGSIPDDLGCLSSLESLDLSENNFTTLPDSIRQLSQLRELSLNRCNKLNSLPDLPLRIKYVYARGCASLELIQMSKKYGLPEVDD